MGLLLVLVMFALALFGTALLIARLVYPDPKPAWQQRLEGGLGRFLGRPRSPAPVTPDPIELLRLQQRLGAIASQLQALQEPSYAAAGGHRLQALRAAYDDLLAEGCRLAGVPPLPGVERGERLRAYEEQALTERGWSW